MSVEKENQSRLSRWSKRKLANAKEADAEVVAALPEDQELNPEEQAALAAEHEANKLAAEAVDLETMNEDTDFSVFMKDGVPELLKKSAMAALWRTNPVFANVDGLVDYDDDFGSPDLIMKTFKSAYQIGKGYLEKIEEEGEKSDQSRDDEAVETEEDLTEDGLSEDEVIADIEGETDIEPVEASIEDTQVETAEAEVPDESKVYPKVSLRHRLMLDG